MDVTKESKVILKKLAKRENAIPSEEHEQKVKDGSPKSSEDRDWAQVTP